MNATVEIQRWLTEQSIAGVGVVQDGCVAYANARFAEIFGYARGEIIGVSVVDLVAETDRDRLLSGIQEQTAVRSADIRTSFRGRRRDGSLVHVEVHGNSTLFQGRSAAIGVVLDIGERRRAEESARDSEEKYRSIFENAIEGIFQTGVDGRFITVNPALSRILGYASPEELLDFAPDRTRWLYLDPARSVAFREAIEAQGRVQAFESQMRRKDGKVIWISENARALRGKAGELIGYEGTLAEITPRKEVEEALRKSEERYALAAQGARDALWDWDVVRDRFYVSTRWKEMIGLDADEVGPRPVDWLTRVHPEDRKRVLRQTREHIEGESEKLDLEYRLLHRDGSYRWMLMRGVAVRDGAGKATRVAGSQSDITVRKFAEEKLRHDAFHDGLTGLVNRALFVDHLGQSLARYQHRGAQFSVLFIDLDRFKVVNDSLGHLAGDELLVGVAGRLLRCARPGDTVARLGGDEFCLLLEDVPGPAEAALVAERIQQELRRPLTLGLSAQAPGHEVFITPSIGIAHARKSYHSPEEIMRDADTAMYRAKARGRGGHAEFDPSMHATAVALLQLESDLRRALDRHELVLHYQPVVSLATGRIAGFEALCHWNHPQRGLLRPMEFVPLAEETGLVVPLGAWALREACLRTRAWQERFPQTSLTVAVNLSARQLAELDLVETISRILEETRLPPGSLRLELTESVLIEQEGRAAQLMLELRALGVSLDLDDFGTGYSSLSYLHDFKIDTLKIDRSFLQRARAQGWEIVRAIVSLARALGLTLIAEGVETNEQLTQLRALSVELAQGYLFSRPLPALELEALLASGRALCAPEPGLAAALPSRRESGERRD